MSEEPEFNALPPEFEERMRQKRQSSRQERAAGATAHRKRFADYELEELMGEGPAARVYRARGADGSVVALKILRHAVVQGEERQGARAEFLASIAPQLASTRQAHLLPILGLVRDGEESALVLELHEEPTLEEALRRRPAYPWAEVLRVGEQLCDALAALHAAGIVHDDIKPRNILLGDNGDALLLDVGSAREVHPGMSDRALALTGSPQYMAPERLRGEAASERSDVYALGVVLFRMLSGRLPVKGPLVAQLRQAYARGEMAALQSPLGKLPTSVVEAVQFTLRVDPNQRPATMAALRDRLHAARQPAATASPAPSRGWLRRLFGRW